MDRPGKYLFSETSQKKTIYVITYMWNLKYDTNEHIHKKYNRFTDIENIFVVGKGVGGRKRKDWEFRISRCKPLYRNR